MSSLMSAGDGPVARCAVCGAPAAGPCARCHRLVCPDCCELTEGGASTFAVCTRCVRVGGRTLAPAWLGLLGWLGLVMLALGAVWALVMLL